MKTNNKYDVYFSLGETCSCSMTLRYLKLQNYSYPLDWSGAWSSDLAGTCGFLGKIALIERHFKDAFNKEDFFETNYAVSSPHRFIRNSRTGLQYVHDFPWEVSVDEYFNEFKNKYERRINRFYDTINRSKKVLFVFIARWGGELSPDEILEGYNRLCKLFNHVKIDLLIFQKKDILDTFQVQRLQLSPNIKYIFYNDSSTTDNKEIGNLIILRKEIMRYLGYQYIDFSTDKILATGLSHREHDGCWSNGKSCLFSFNINDFIQGDAILEFDVIPYINSKHQKLKVYISCVIDGNVDSSAEWIFEIGKQCECKLIISEKVTKTKQCNLIFNFDSPCSPFICGESEDRRELGIFFRTIKISMNV